MGCSGCCGEESVKAIEKQDPGPDPNFPDMEEWEGERYSGIGIRKMKGYKCNLPIDELINKKKLFWDTKINENKNWEIIAKICIEDEERIKQNLEIYNLKLKNNCINHIIGPDGTHYHVPNYCINDPYFEKELLKDDVEEKKINLNLIEKSGNDQYNIKVEFSNHDSGQNIKKAFIEKTNMNENEYKLRLYFSGTEIKDNDLIFHHKLQDNDNIIIFKLKI